MKDTNTQEGKKLHINYQLVTQYSKQILFLRDHFLIDQHFFKFMMEGIVVHRAANWTVVAQEYGDYPSSAGDVFALSFAHGATAGPLCYSVALANRVAPSPAPAIVRSKSATAVLRGKDVTQVVFWESSSVALSTGHKLRASAPCVLIASAIATGRWQVWVADPSRELRSLTLEIERTDAGGKPCMWGVPLPNGTAVGSAAVGFIECAGASE